MTGASVAFTKPPQPGVGPWTCPHCTEKTVTCYRCSNPICGKDLTNETLARWT